MMWPLNVSSARRPDNSCVVKPVTLFSSFLMVRFLTSSFFIGVQPQLELKEDSVGSTWSNVFNLVNVSKLVNVSNLVNVFNFVNVFTLYASAQ
jgi:hypothetical protein